MLLVVPVDDGLSAVNRSGLGNDLAVLVSAGLDEAALGSAVNSVGEGVQENVIADSIRIRILAVGEGERGSSGGVLGGIDIELDGSLGAQVALSVISGRSNIGDLGEEGVDHDDNVIIFLRPNTRRLSRFPVVAAKIFKSSNCCKNDKESQKIGRINAKNVRFSCYCIPLATRKKPAAQWLCGPVVVAVWQRSAATTIFSTLVARVLKLKVCSSKDVFLFTGRAYTHNCSEGNERNVNHAGCKSGSPE